MLRSLLDWTGIAGRLDELAPERVELPSGRRVAVDYSADPPVLAVKLQELLGATTTPSIAGGRLPLVLHLLSPAGRPAAVTGDLASFWTTGYPQVRAELRGRYPKHAWPEDPLAVRSLASTLATVSSMKARSLLDPSFKTRMTPVLLPWIYLFLVGALGRRRRGARHRGASSSPGGPGLVALVVVPVGAAVVFALLRVICELLMDFSRLPQVTSTMADGLVRMESTVDGVAEDMPRIAFLRGTKQGLRRRPRQPPGENAGMTGVVQGIDPDELRTALAVLAAVEELPRGPSRRGRRPPRHGRDLQDGAQAAPRRQARGGAGRRPGRHRGHRHRRARPDRRRDGRAAAGSARGRVLRGRAAGRAGLLHLQAALHARRLLLPPALPDLRRTHHAKRDARTDLTGRRALLTGGRAKIGMYIALRLLRDGAHTTITTRFPNDAVRRFADLPDSGDWLHRLRVVGIDLRDPAQVVALADDMAGRGHLDILINNAAQTVRRPPGSYSALAAAEREPAPELVETITFGHVGSAHPTALEQGVSLSHEHGPAHAVTALALTAATPTLEAVIDAGGLVPDTSSENSWSRVVHEIDPLELLEVQLCNQTAPYLLVSRLRPALAAAPARRTYVVNVSAMEGQFSRKYKGPGHPHTNMAKAALNMLTRTSAGEMLATDGILMTAVDTGWITDERPHPTKARLADEGFHAPLDLVDGAARVYDPIVRGEAGEDVYGCFLKDYQPSPW